MEGNVTPGNQPWDRRKTSKGKKLAEVEGKVWYFGSLVKQCFKMGHQHPRTDHKIWRHGRSSVVPMGRWGGSLSGDSSRATEMGESREKRVGNTFQNFCHKKKIIAGGCRIQRSFYWLVCSFKFGSIERCLSKQEGMKNRPQSGAETVIGKRIE